MANILFRKLQVEGLEATDPVAASKVGINMNYSSEAVALLQKEGPKYQYGNGCLSDGILGAWMGKMAGLPDFLDETKVTSHLNSVYKYNLKTDLSDHVNPQRPSYGLGKEGGLLLCSWPHGDALTLPFVYSNEVWTGIEYQVASHLMCEGEVDKKDLILFGKCEKDTMEKSGIRLMNMSADTGMHVQWQVMVCCRD